MTFLRKYWLPIFFTGLLVLTHWLTGYLVWCYAQAQHNEYVAKRDGKDDTARLVATEKERRFEQALQTAVQNTDAAKAEQERLRAVVAVADGTHDRLLSELEITRANLRGQGDYSTLAERSVSATRAAMVLSDLFGSCSARLKDLGGAVDQAQSRGRQCELSYNTVRELSNKAP